MGVSGGSVGSTDSSPSTCSILGVRDRLAVAEVSRTATVPLGKGSVSCGYREAMLVSECGLDGLDPSPGGRQQG